MDLKKVLAALPWKLLLLSVYKEVLRPFIAKKVVSSEAEWDDAVFEYADGLVGKLLGGLEGEPSMEDMKKEALKVEA